MDPHFWVKLVLKQIRENKKTTNLVFRLTCTDKSKDRFVGSVDKNTLKLAAYKQPVIRSENSTPSIINVVFMMILSLMAAHIR